MDECQEKSRANIGRRDWNVKKRSLRANIWRRYYQFVEEEYKKSGGRMGRRGDIRGHDVTYDDIM